MTYITVDDEHLAEEIQSALETAAEVLTVAMLGAYALGANFEFCDLVEAAHVRITRAQTLCAEWEDEGGNAS